VTDLEGVRCTCALTASVALFALSLLAVVFLSEIAIDLSIDDRAAPLTRTLSGNLKLAGSAGEHIFPIGGAGVCRTATWVTDVPLRLITSYGTAGLAPVAPAAKIDRVLPAAARDAALVPDAFRASLFVERARITLSIARKIAHEVLSFLATSERPFAGCGHEDALLTSELRPRIDAPNIRRLTRVPGNWLLVAASNRERDKND
jgi:hypothetical protein